MMGAGVEGDIHDMITMLEQDHDDKKKAPAAVRLTVVVTGFEGDDSTSSVFEELRKNEIDGYYLALQKLPANEKDVGEKVPRLWKVYNNSVLFIHLTTHSTPKTVKFVQLAPNNEGVLKSEIHCGQLANHLNKKLESKLKLEKLEEPERALDGYCYALSLREDPSKTLLIGVPGFDAECTKEHVTQVIRETILAVTKKEVDDAPDGAPNAPESEKQGDQKKSGCCTIM